jgi:hypothetical protein
VWEGLDADMTMMNDDNFYPAFRYEEHIDCVAGSWVLDYWSTGTLQAKREVGLGTWVFCPLLQRFARQVGSAFNESALSYRIPRGFSASRRFR